MNWPRASKRRVTAYLVGVTLLVAATWNLAEHHAVAESAWAALRHPSPAWLVALPLAILISFALTGLSLQILANRVARLSTVRFGEMFALTLASALGNLAPVQAGLVGRIAYQSQVHGIPVPVSVLLAVQSTLLTLIAGAWLGISLWIVRHVDGASWIAAPMTYALLACALVELRWRRSAFLRALLVRCMEVLLSAVRVHAAFTLTGCTIDPMTSLALGAAGNVSNAIPFLGGALGVREWIVAILAPALSGITTPEALAAELVSRCVEMLIVVAGGLASAPALARRLSNAMRTRPIEPGVETTGWSVTMSTGGLGDAQRPSGVEPPVNTLPPPSS
jgi:uncharacterized membrane protein YbhN (UPF0104 family)